MSPHIYSNSDSCESAIVCDSDGIGDARGRLRNPKLESFVFGWATAVDLRIGETGGSSFLRPGSPFCGFQRETNRKTQIHLLGVHPKKAHPYSELVNSSSNIGALCFKLSLGRAAEIRVVLASCSQFLPEPSDSFGKQLCPDLLPGQPSER